MNFTSPNTDVPPTPGGRRSKAEADALRAQQQALPQIPVPATQALPTQETGTRPSRALPYELHTSARVETDGRRVRLLFANGGRAGAVFHVYDKLHLDRLPRRYMVEAGKTLDDVWDVASTDAGRYDLWVLGPNGFHRSFAGELPAAASGAEIQVCYDLVNTAVYLKLQNTGTAHASFTIRSRAYRQDGPWTVTVQPGAVGEQHWTVADSGQWYDFEVTVDVQPAFRRRFAGRLETGKDTVSDPAMGLGS